MRAGSGAIEGARGTGAVAASPVLAAVPKPVVPPLTGELPENDVHLIKARLLANASLNEYIAPEIQASPTSARWGALAQAEIYVSYGEFTRALQSMKRSGISFFALPMDRVSTAYWHLLFPQPYWDDLVADAGNHGLDPYLVASLIRQESEFNAGAVSRANAYGLMQLLPSMEKAARKEGVKRFSTNQLLNPATNMQLGTPNLSRCWTGLGGRWSMRWRLITRAMFRCGSGWRAGTIRIFRSSWSRFRIRRRAIMCRRFCATGRCIRRCTRRSSHSSQPVFPSKMGG